MMKNNTFEEIGNRILKADKILLYPHVNVDGDALGSSVALCRALRNAGKTCYVLMEDDIPANLAFMAKDYCTKDQNIIKKPGLSISIDCGDESRFFARKEKFNAAKHTMCIDHHRTTAPYCEFNYIDSDAAATGELIYELLQTMKLPIDREIGEALFAAIATDTGNFTYSNTSKKTHEIMAKLYDAGIDANETAVELYENVRMERILIQNKALGTLSTICGGKGVIAYVTQDMLAETGALMEETESVVQQLRSINGVEVAAFLKEVEDEKVKVSLRSKKTADVAAIAEAFNGGGHVRAAGFTLECNLTQAFDLVKEKITDSLGKL